MKNYLKIFTAAGVIIALASLGAPNANAAGRRVAVGFAGSFAGGVVVGALLAQPCPPPVVYAYSPPVYISAPVVFPQVRVDYVPAPYVYPCYVPPFRSPIFIGHPAHYHFRR